MLGVALEDRRDVGLAVADAGQMRNRIERCGFLDPHDEIVRAFARGTGSAIGDRDEGGLERFEPRMCEKSCSAAASVFGGKNSKENVVRRALKISRICIVQAPKPITPPATGIIPCIGKIGPLKRAAVFSRPPFVSLAAKRVTSSLHIPHQSHHRRPSSRRRPAPARGRRRRGRRWRWRRRPRRRLAWALYIASPSFMRALLQIVQGILQGVLVFALHQFLDAVEGAFDVAAFLRADLAAVLLQLLFDLQRQGIGLVPQIDELAALLVFRRRAPRLPSSSARFLPWTGPSGP